MKTILMTLSGLVLLLALLPLPPEQVIRPPDETPVLRGTPPAPPPVCWIPPVRARRGSGMRICLPPRYGF